MKNVWNLIIYFIRFVNLVKKSILTRSIVFGIGIIVFFSFICQTHAQIECGNEMPSNYSYAGDCNYPVPDVNLTIPLYFHEVYSSVTSNPVITNEDLKTLVEKVNTIFNKNGINIQFVLAKFNEKGLCFNGLSSHDYREGAGTIYQDLAGDDIEKIYPNQGER